MNPWYHRNNRAKNRKDKELYNFRAGLGP